MCVSMQLCTAIETVKTRMLAYYGHTMRKQGSYLEKEIMQGTMPGVGYASEEGHARPGWTTSRRGPKVEESIRMTGQAQMEKVRPWCGHWPTIVSRTAKEQNRL